MSSVQTSNSHIDLPQIGIVFEVCGGFSVFVVEHGAVGVI